MKNYALIDATNAIVSEQLFDETPPQLAPKKGLIWLELIETHDICTEDQQLGDPVITDNRESGTVTKHFPAVAKPVPSEITNWQAKKQLVVEGVYERVDAAISTMGASAQIDWNHAAVFKRHYPLIAQMQAFLGRTDAETDAYFIAANKLQ